MICIGVDIKSSLKSIELSKKFKNIFASAGFHPHESKDATTTYINEIEKLLNLEKVVALGEIGLDYHYDHSDRKIQNIVYNEQLELAKSLNIPSIIHCRNAENDIITGIKNTGATKGVIHCFSGNQNFADNLFELGFLISFTGMITFNKSLESIVKNVPLNKIMLETDSPYLTPHPYRGKRNEPAMVKVIAEKIANIKNISLNEVANQTTKNAEELFGI